jgi:cyclopropane fatty-acyl-phospholipid synthase-like methyltransferase
MSKKMEIKPIEKCRLCGSGDFDRLFSLGDLYISTFVNKPGENIGKAPLTLTWCNNCSLVQLEHTAPQELMYSKHYWYRSGLNKVIINDLKEISEVATKMVSLREGDVVLDLGANDGTLLSFYPKTCIKIGCEPATNLTEELKKQADICIDDFWTYDKYQQIFGDKKAKVITAIGMFYDMENPNQFIKDSAMALDKDGIFIAQLMTSKPMLEKNDVGNICHEHIEYYSYQALKYLFESNGLEIFKVEENSINGGSYRLFARHYQKGSIDYKEDITKERYLEFAKRIEKNKEDFLRFIEKILKEGKKVYGYAASTKGNTILQYYGLTGNHISGIAEISKEKLGKYTVGSNIPVIEEKIAKENADYMIIFPYAFKDSFVQKEKEWLAKGGKFIVPLPYFEIIESQKGDVEEITHDGKRLAVVSKKHNFSGKNFISSKEDYLQVGYMNLKKGEKIIPHFHKELLRIISKTQEVIYIASGKMRVDFYVDKIKVKDAVLETGDLLVLLDGGHGFDFLEETNLIELKQGPYLDFDADKERF